MAIGDLISTNTAVGTGKIETPGVRDIYTFQGAPGQTIYFDAQSGDNCGTPLLWRCTDSSGAVLFNQRLAAGGPCGPTDPGLIVLTNGGTYNVTVYAIGDGTGPYQLQVWNVTN